MKNPPNFFVLFADMLGFRRLVLDNKVPYPENLEFRGRPVAGARMGSLGDIGNPLSRAFTAFHGGIHDVLNSLERLEAVSLLVFSDSLFLAAPESRDCLRFAESLMRSCIARGAPMRMGVGYGTFVSFGFSFEESPSTRFLSSQFFGTGVIHATKAEEALKGKGMRIAIHRCAAEAMMSNSVRVDKLLAMPAAHASPDVAHEWNYLPEWPEIPRMYGVQDPDPEVPQKIRMHVERMLQSAGEDVYVQQQYDDTKEALNRMGKAIDNFLKERNRTYGN